MSDLQKNNEKDIIALAENMQMVFSRLGCSLSDLAAMLEITLAVASIEDRRIKISSDESDT